MAIYKLPLDDELDKDIIDWIASFPRNRKSEMVRQAIRNTINGEAVKASPPVRDEDVKESTVGEQAAKGKDDGDIFEGFEDNMKIIKKAEPKSLDGLF